MTTDFKPKFISWYEDDFRADRIVARMHPHARAMYRNLLMESYYNPERPYLPDNDELLWQLADAENKKAWQRHKEAVLQKFTRVTIDGKNLLQNKRVMEEWDKMVDLLGKRQHAGAVSAAKRIKNRSMNTPPHTTPHQHVEQSSTGDEHMLNTCSEGGKEGSSFQSSLVKTSPVPCSSKDSQETFEVLQGVWGEFRVQFMDERELDEKTCEPDEYPPLAMPKQGWQKLWAALQRKEIDAEDTLLPVAFERFLKDRYARSFDEVQEGGTAIRLPLAIFADELEIYLGAVLKDVRGADF